MRSEHDRDANAIYITLSRGTYAYGEDLDSERRVDDNSTGEPLGIELLAVSQGVALGDLPESEDVGRLLADHDVPVFA
ncbi:MAG: hypothetical protein ACYCZN_00365 [Candidatus Dormibacteria bacterium]